MLVQRDRLAHAYSEHVAARSRQGPSGCPAEFEEAMRALSELQTISEEAAVADGLERLCVAVAVAEDALETKQDALRTLVGPQPAPADVLEQLVRDRDALRNECQAQQRLLLAATSAEELQRLRRLWESRLETIETVLDLSPGGWTDPPAPDAAGLTELEQLHQTSSAMFAAIAQRSEAISQRLARANQDTDAVATRLAEVLLSTASRLQRTQGRASEVSCVSITDLFDELLAAIEAERMTWAKAELEQPFPSDYVLASCRAYRQLCEGLLATLNGVQAALASASQAAERDHDLCNSAEATERVGKLSDLRKEELRKKKEYRRAKEDYDDGDVGDGAAGRLAELRQDLVRVRCAVQSNTLDLANLAFSAFPELLAGAHGSTLLPSLEFGGLLKEGATLADFDEPPILLHVDARHPIWTARENGKKVVLKEYLLADGASRSGFKRELRALQRLQHPAIVQLLAVIIEPSGRAYVQMPSYECNLAEWAARGGHSEQRLQQVLSELTRALEHVHSQAMLHGDLKAENVFIDTQAGHPHPRLGDFDLSHDTSGRSLSLSRTASTAGGPTGTVGYLAPELLAGQPATFASDIYALGRTMYFVHFQAQQGSAATLPGDVVIPAHPNRDLTVLLRQLLNADPTKRPTAAQAASAAYFTTSLLVEKEQAAALWEALQAELTAARSTQQRLEKETQAFVAQQRALSSTEEQLRVEQAEYSKLSQERKAALAGQAQALQEREAKLQQMRAQLSGERAKLQDERKRQAEAEAALNEKQRELRASVALVQTPPIYWSSALTATAFSQYDVTAEMRTRMQGVVDKSCTVFGVGRDLRTPWGPYTGLRVKKVVPANTDPHLRAERTHTRTRARVDARPRARMPSHNRICASNGEHAHDTGLAHREPCALAALQRATDVRAPELSARGFAAAARRVLRSGMDEGACSPVRLQRAVPLSRYQTGSGPSHHTAGLRDAAASGRGPDAR